MPLYGFVDLNFWNRNRIRGNKIIWIKVKFFKKLATGYIESIYPINKYKYKYFYIYIYKHKNDLIKLMTKSL